MHTLPPCLDRFPRLAVLRTNYTKQQRMLGFESHFAIEKVWFTTQHEHRRVSSWRFPPFRDHDAYTRDLAVLLVHLIVTLAQLLGPGGARPLVAESIHVK